MINKLNFYNDSVIQFLFPFKPARFFTHWPLRGKVQHKLTRWSINGSKLPPLNPTVTDWKPTSKQAILNSWGALRITGKKKENKLYKIVQKKKQYDIKESIFWFLKVKVKPYTFQIHNRHGFFLNFHLQHVYIPAFSYVVIHISTETK